ncbi:hypothetical protein L6452_32572 [Arctium lappa]|uniref:Uncharacterized protein n=1 Tax=Arctium lappa TaxID=4217 RepID=A0ACB8Z4V6_ARCLA|nr:hypothetical protein L6452_32572 [Arctium lappa]
MGSCSSICREVFELVLRFAEKCSSICREVFEHVLRFGEKKEGGSFLLIPLLNHLYVIDPHPKLEKFFKEKP